VVRNFSGDSSEPQSSRSVATMSLAARTAWLLRQFGLRPRKARGQNFLIDEHHANRIVEAALRGNPQQVVEIGGGLGALTLPLAQSGVALTVYELDWRLAEALSWLTEHLDNVKIITEDVLEAELSGGDNVVAVGNLPYYATTPILECLFAARPPFAALVVTVQREVGERIQAKPGTKAYGPLTLWCQFYAESSELVGRLPATVFRPQSGVESIALRMGLRREPPAAVAHPASFFAGVRGALGHRRKTLANSLRSDRRLGLSGGQVAAILKVAELDGSRRGETLDFQEFARLGNALTAEIGPMSGGCDEGN